MFLEEIFNKTKETLISKFGNEVQIHDEGSYFNLGDTGFWMEFDTNSKELTVGYGLTHIHCRQEFENIDSTIEALIGLLTKPVQFQTVGNKKYNFKESVSYLDSKNKPKNFGTSQTFNLRFWESKKVNTIKIPALLDNSNYELEIKKLYTTQV